MWEIYAYQNADSLFGIFNAVAAIRGSGTYLSAIAAVAFCGFVAALLAYAFAPHKLQGWQWLASVVLVYSVLFVPRVAVGIVDKTGGAAVKVVDNVPFGLALFGGVTSTIGNTLTELFETAFQMVPGNASLPNELTYQKNGLVFGNRLIREAGIVAFQDPAFRTDLVNFIHNCTMYDLIDGTLDPNTFAHANDVWILMANPNPARFTPLSGAGGSVTTDTCPNAYRNLDRRLPDQITRLQGSLASRLNPTLPGPVAATVIVGQIQQAYLKNQLADAAATAADIIRQNAMLNAIHDTSQLIGQKINDPASMVLAVGRAQALAQTNAAWINQGKIAEQALPVVRNVVEALAYAMFPLVVLLLFLTSGRDTVLALKNYLAVLIWIQLWPPLYAILNYMASLFAASEFAAAANVGGGITALSLLTASPIYANALSAEAIVGYLTISIPFIAWAALKRMENFGNAVIGGLTGLQAAASATTGAAATGNVSMGNVAMDQMQLAPNRSSVFMRSWQDDATGNTITSNVSNGRTAINLLRNQGFASRVVSMRVSEQDVTEAHKQVDAARGEAVAAQTERSAVLADTLMKGIAKYRSSRTSHGTSSSSFEQIGEHLTRLDQLTKGVAERTGLSQSQVAQIAFGAAGHLGASTPFAGVDIKASADKSSQAAASTDQQKVLGSMTTNQIAEFKQFGDRVARDTSVVEVLGADTKDAHDLSARLATANARTDRAEATLAARVGFAEKLASARDRGETFSIDIAQDPHNVEMFRRYAEQYGGNSAAAFALFEAELARQGLHANRTFSDGTALPTSFHDIEALHRQNASDPRLHLEPVDVDRENRRAVSDSHTIAAIPRSTSPVANTNARATVEVQKSAIRDEVDSRSREAQAGTTVTRDESGTLLVNKSLVKDAARQAARDVSDTFENLKHSAKDLLNKK